MKYIYIDGGARIGESISILLDPREELKGCDAYLFECNVNHFSVLNSIKDSNTDYNFIVKEEAMWIENIEKNFFISNDRWGDLGCTLKPEKKEKLDLDNPIKVKCIDTSEFLKQFDNDNYIILKLDVEGSEYEILNHLIETGEINKINELYVEFHDYFFNQNSNILKNKLKSYNIKCDFNWM
jgi:FkbM family methyltransferase